jgi:probable DNA metabolism protein
MKLGYEENHTETEMHRFVCKDEFGAIMSCVYEAWRWENRGYKVELAVEAAENYRLFCVEHPVEYDEERSCKVIRSIRTKISERAFQLVYDCAMSVYPEKVQVIYEFLRIGFSRGATAVDCLTEEPVIRIVEITRQVGNEAHRFIQFARFSRLEEGVLCSLIEPRSNVLTMIAPHFSDRMISENWMIVDKKRKLAVLHPSDRPWYLRSLTAEEFAQILDFDRDHEEYAALWRTFFEHIGIKQRKNTRCQDNFMPKWYRTNMTEFR